MVSGTGLTIATAEVDCQALRHNFQIIQALARNSEVLAIIKAHAYGHGLLEVAKTLESFAYGFGVSRLSEAVTLREAGIQKPILLLEGVYSADELLIVSVDRLSIVIHCEEQLQDIEQVNLPQPIDVWMKLDTGMHRLGFRHEQQDRVYQRLSQSKNIKQPINLISHFSRADEADGKPTEQQLSAFNEFTKDKPGLKSFAASAGILKWPQSYYNMIRPGIILYGISPIDGIIGETFGIKPVMTLKSCLIAVRQHKKGEPIGYGGTWVSDRDTRIGVIAFGYGDGYPRSARSGTPVLVNGREVALAGRVSMDMICVDLGPEATDKIGDEVILWGKQLPIERVASHSGLSAYELITRLTSRIKYTYIN